MSVSKISKRYAKSLVDLSRNKKNLDEVVGDVKSFLNLAGNREFKVFLKSPIIHAEKKSAVFNEMFKGKIQEDLLNFFHMVIKKGRENILMEILEVVVDMYNELKGVTKVVITSAVKLSDKEFDKISAKLKNTSLASENVEFEEKVDPALIGGFIIQVGDKRYDASIAGKLKKLNQELIS
jgi:F-type H+-transporting ATPase subunit delta